MTLTELIAAALPNLAHPGDDTHPPTTLTLPIFRPQTLPPEQAAEFAEQAKLPSSDLTHLVAEALVALITTDHEVLTKTEAVQLRADAQSGRDRHRQPRIHCTCHNEFLFSLNIDSERPTIDGHQLAAALKATGH
jgi:hypothetical protein